MTKKKVWYPCILTSHISNTYLNNDSLTVDNQFPKVLEEIWVDLYERGYVEIEDVYLVSKTFRTKLGCLLN